MRLSLSVGDVFLVNFRSIPTKGFSGLSKARGIIQPKIFTLAILVIAMIDGLETLFTTGDFRPVVLAVGKRISSSDTIIKEGIETLRVKNVAPCVLSAENTMCVVRVFKEIYLTMAFIGIVGSVFILAFYTGFFFSIGRHTSSAGTSTGYLNLVASVIVPLFLTLIIFNLLIEKTFVFPFSGIRALVVNWRIFLPFIVA